MALRADAKPRNREFSFVIVLRFASSCSRQNKRACMCRLSGDGGGEGGIRTPVPLTRQDAFEAPPLRPLRYLSVSGAPAWPAGAPGGACGNTDYTRPDRADRAHEGVGGPRPAGARNGALGRGLRTAVR